MGGTVIVGACNGTVRGLNKRTGELQWTYDARADGGRPEFHGAPLVADAFVIIASDDRRPDGVGYIYALDAASGSLRWKTRVGRGSMADIIRLGKQLCAVTLDNELVVLDLETGKRAWSFPAAPPLDPGFANLVNSPAVSSDRLYFGGADGVAYAFSAKTRALLWRTEVGSRIVTPLGLAGDALYLGTQDARLVRIDRHSGRLVAEIKLPGTAFGPPVVTDTTILVFHAEGEALVLNGVEPSLSQVRWTRRAPNGWSSSRPFVWRGLVWAGGEQGEISELAMEDGSVKWTRRVDGVVRGIGADGESLFVGTLKGLLYAVRP